MRHARPDVLKAAAVTVPLVCELERHHRDGCANVLIVRDTVSAFIRTAPSHAGDIGAFMLGAADHLDRNLVLISSFNPEERQGVEAYMERLRAPVASNGGGPAGAVGLPPVAIFVPELWEAFDFAAELAASLLAQEGLSLPEVSKSTSFKDEVGASSGVHDTASKMHSEVTLVLPKAGFTINSLYAVPYLLAHEMICHVAQGVLGAPPRQGSGPHCPWSDGWMDILAYDETCAHLMEGVIGQAWIDDSRMAAMANAHEVHAHRYAAAGGKNPNYDERKEARQAYDGLVRAFIAHKKLSEDEAVARRRSFSLIYNASPVSPADRQAFVPSLLAQLNVRRRVASALDAVDAFIEDRNAAKLHRAVCL